jgi:hypothetical protein
MFGCSHLAMMSTSTCTKFVPTNQQELEIKFRASSAEITIGAELELWPITRLYLKGIEFLIVGVLDNLNRHDLTGFQEPRLVHIAKTSLPDALNCFIGCLRVNALLNIVGYSLLGHGGDTILS